MPTGPAYSPTQGDLHVDAALTNLSVAYAQDQTNFVADVVFPPVPVNHQTDEYHRFDRSDFYRDEMRKRGRSSESAGSGFRLTPDAYRCDIWALHKDVDDRDTANHDPAADPVLAANRWITLKGLIRRDAEWADNYFKAGVWTTERQGVDTSPVVGTSFLQWNNTGSTPILDVDEAKTAVHKLTGYMPNVMVIGEAVFRALRSNTDMTERIKYTQRGIVTVELMASLFDVDRVVVARGVNYTGDASESDPFDGDPALYDYIVNSTGVLLAYANPTPSIMEPSAGYTFNWTAYLGASEMGSRIKRFRIEEKNSDRIEIEMAFDMKVVAKDCAAWLADAVASA